jgi:ribosomal protein L16 Arg81 hydroxylase
MVDFYRDLISLEHIERYLSLEDIFRRPDTIFMRGRDFWTRGEPPRNFNEACERMQRGQSLQLRNLESVLDPSTPLPSLVRNMERDLQHQKLSIGCYISRAQASGLGPHHDDTEIFTLQVAGRKRWRLYHQVHTDKPGVYDPATLDAPAHDVLLEAGDVLYHPRGWIHDVLSEDVASFSITIVFQPLTWKAVLDWIVNRLGDKPPFVDQMPAGVLLNDRATDRLRQPFEERIAYLRNALSQISLDEIVQDLVAARIAQLTPAPDDRLEALLRIDLLTLDSRLEPRRDMPTNVVANADTVTLLLPGGYRVVVPASQEPAVRWVLGIARTFHVHELDGALSDDEKLTLAKRLMACGLLGPA